MVMHAKFLPHVALVTYLYMISGCSVEPALKPPPESALYARFVLLASPPGGETAAFARVVFDEAGGYDCPSISGRSDILMTPRHKPALNPGRFAVTVCEAAVPFGQELNVVLSDTTLSLPVAKNNPSRILVMGDTGCKEPETGSDGGTGDHASVQGCEPGAPAQPFAKLAKAAASAEPADLILHMGDYNYRGTPSKISVKGKQEYAYDAGDGTEESEQCLQAPDSKFYSQNADKNSPHDMWETWRDDFFRPAGDLLSSAPWVFARGNHELCSRAGPGWFYFLDPSSGLPEGGGKQTSCPTPNPKAEPLTNVVINEPYRVDLESLNVIVFDSANACDAFVAPSAFAEAYLERSAGLAKLTDGSQTSWFMTHRPIWGVQGYTAETTTGCTPNNDYSCINQTMQAAMGRNLPEGIKLSLAGHMHHFQSLTFPAESGRPPQLIVGDGGVELSDDGIKTPSFEVQVQEKEAQARQIGKKSATGVQGYGFLEIDYESDGSWSGVLANTAKSVTLAECGSNWPGGNSICELTR